MTSNTTPARVAARFDPDRLGDASRRAFAALASLYDADYLRVDIALELVRLFGLRRKWATSLVAWVCRESGMITYLEAGRARVAWRRQRLYALAPDFDFEGSAAVWFDLRWRPLV